MAHCRTRDDAGNHRFGARGWLVTAFLALLGAAVGWVLVTRRRGQQAIAGDPWATPVPSVSTVPLAEPASTPTEPAPTAPPAAATPAGGGTTPAPYGDGSAAPLADGSAPEGYPIKGNAKSRLFHPADSPYYGRTKAEVWFRDEESAGAAGFRRWDHKRRS